MEQMANLKLDWQANLIKSPKYAWKCELMKGTWWMVEEGKQPNRFHRKMQELCFGFKWEKIDG
jgi:hypothetical protein